jgi:hypothetical protein
MSGINSGHHNLPTYEISLQPLATWLMEIIVKGDGSEYLDFEEISSKLTSILPSKNFYWSPFSKWPPQYRTNSTFNTCKIKYNKI